MNTSELVAAMAQAAHITQAKAQVALATLLDRVTVSLKKGEPVT